MLHTPINFVAFNTNAPILRILVRILKRGTSWECIGISEIEQLQTTLENNPTDVLVIGVGGKEPYLSALEAYCSENDIHIIHHYGGGSGLLFNSIQAYLNQKEQTR
jgi:hypothetical protein